MRVMEMIDINAIQAATLGMTAEDYRFYSEWSDDDEFGDPYDRVEDVVDDLFEA